MVQMGKLIRQLRKQQKMTQKMLAEGIVSESVMSRIENGSTDPDLFTVNQLLQRLGKSLAYFEIIVSNREYELLKKKEYEGKLETVVIAEGEYFKDIREAMGLSQEKFSSDICARETISNIEHGRTPQRRKIKDLMEKQGAVFQKYYGYVMAQEYELYELVNQYQNMLSDAPEEAKKLRQEIGARLDMSHPVNRQFMESSELMEKNREGLLTTGEVLAGLEHCLRYTMPDYDGEMHRIPFQQEVLILEEIVKCMNLLNRTEAAGQLWKKVEKKNRKKLKLSQNVTAL